MAEAKPSNGDVIDYSKFGRKGAKARKAWLELAEKHYDPNTTVYVDELWMRVHAADCPSLLLKEHKKTMTLEAADRAGYRIGESGQSGREHCCFHGYRLKYPHAEIPEDALGTVQILKNGEPKWHLAGCHRFSPQRDHARMTQQRYFFGGYNLHKAYRATGDKRLLDRILGEARHYHALSVNYLSAAQVKARDPEGMAYLYDMAGWARITLQLARKHPGQVSPEEVAEAEAFLKSIVAVLQPTCEGNENLDPEMGIPKQLADDFRSRAWNRAMNGIGTIGLTTAALEDLQVLKDTREYQPTIDRYRKVIGEYI